MQIISQLELLNLGVSDVDKSKEFYADKLGLKVKTERKFGTQHFVSMELPGGVILNIMNVLEHKQPGIYKLGFSTTDVAAALQELAAKGLKPTKEGDDYNSWNRTDGKGDPYFELDDPDGNRVLIYQQSKQ